MLRDPTPINVACIRVAEFSRPGITNSSVAQVVKLFSTHLDRVSESYSPAKFVSVAKDAISNTPDLDRAGTSHVE